MAGLRFSALQKRPMELLDLTSVTLNEFQHLVPAFETAFQSRMSTTRFDGKPRTVRRFAVYRTCPLPTPADRLLFVLVYLKTYALQVVHGRLFGMGQSKANQWLHVLLPVLQTALTALGDTPARTLTALAERLGVSLETAAAVLPPAELGPSALAPTPPAVTGPSAPAPTPPTVAGPSALAPTPPAVAGPPLLPMMGPSGASAGPRIRLSRRAVIAVRRSAIP